MASLLEFVEHKNAVHQLQGLRFTDKDSKINVANTVTPS